MSDNVKELSLRIERIEKLVESIAGASRATATDLTEDEVKAYHKVKDVVAADYGHFCGINDCYRCIIVRCTTLCQTICDYFCTACDVECSCGPCNPGSFRGRVNRFGNMG